MIYHPFILDEYDEPPWVHFYWSGKMRGRIPYCQTMKGSPTLFSVLQVSRLLYHEVLVTLYNTTCVQIFIKKRKVQLGDLPTRICPYQHIRDLRLVLQPFKRFAKDLKCFLKKLVWGEFLDVLVVEIGDDCVGLNRNYGGVIKVGLQAEIRDVLAYWGMVRMRGRVNLSCTVTDISLLTGMCLCILGCLEQN